MNLTSILFAEINNWVIAIILIGLALLLWKLLTPKTIFLIKVNQQYFKFKGHLPESKLARIKEFFVNDVQADRPLVVLGVKKGNSRIELRFRGNVDPGTKQQIRNFLLTLL